MTGPGFYSVSPEGELQYAASGISTPTGTYVVADHAAYSYPIAGGWRYFAGASAALVYFTAAQRPSGATVADVIAERDRRAALGFDYNFGDSRGVHRIGTTPADLAGWREVTDLSGALINIGQGAFKIGIETNTGPVQISAMEWQQVLIAAGAARQPVWLASFKLQAMDPIPDDFTADKWWK